MVCLCSHFFSPEVITMTFCKKIKNKNLTYNTLLEKKRFPWIVFGRNFSFLGFGLEYNRGALVEGTCIQDESSP